MFEKTELFQRNIGDGTDIVSKEMYTFTDKGGRSLTLRPEGTASVIRAYLENNLDQLPGICKMFYIMPMWRYERSQAGRYRQHHQFGVEAVGSDSSQVDVEVISLLMSLYQKLNLKNLKLNINSLGCELARKAYKEALINYLTPFYSQLSADSQARLEKNTLRILDSKNERDQEILQEAPTILDFLSEADRCSFDEVQEGLTLMQIPYQINNRLVRGLDYYNKTVFEVVAGELGAQNSIGGGGRYDGLTKQMGGASKPAFGFGTGLERIIQTMISQGVNLPTYPSPQIMIAAMDKKQLKFAFEITHSLRQAGVATHFEFKTLKTTKALQRADQIKAKFLTIIGENELVSGKLLVRNMLNASEQLVEAKNLCRLF